jgi:hypothetical protein
MIQYKIDELVDLTRQDGIDLPTAVMQYSGIGRRARYSVHTSRRDLFGPKLGFGSYSGLLVAKTQKKIPEQEKGSPQDGLSLTRSLKIDRGKEVEYALLLFLHARDIIAYAGALESERTLP